MSRVIVILIVAVVLVSRVTAELFLDRGVRMISGAIEKNVGCELSIDDTPDTDFGDDGMYTWNHHDIIPRDALDQYRNALVLWNKHDSGQHYLEKNLCKLRAKIGKCIASAMKTCVIRRTQICYSRVVITSDAGDAFTTPIVDALEREIKREGYGVDRFPSVGCSGATLKVTVY